MIKKNKSNILKKYYEDIGQISMFGHDNLHFKTINLPNRQRFVNLCSRFKLKLLIKSRPHSMKTIKIFK